MPVAGTGPSEPLGLPDQRPAPDRLAGPDVVAVTDDAVLQVGAATDQGAGQEDGAFYGGFRPYPAVGADRYVAREGGAAADDGVPADEYVTLYVGGGGDLGGLGGPQALAA